MVEYILGLDALLVFDIFLTTLAYLLFTGSAIGYYFEYHKKTIYTELGLKEYKTERFKKSVRKFLRGQE